MARSKNQELLVDMVRKNRIAQPFNAEDVVKVITTLNLKQARAMLANMQVNKKLNSINVRRNRLALYVVPNPIKPSEPIKQEPPVQESLALHEKIEGTAENWETGKLGQDEEFVKVAEPLKDTIHPFDALLDHIADKMCNRLEAFMSDAEHRLGELLAKHMAKPMEKEALPIKVESPEHHIIEPKPEQKEPKKKVLICGLLAGQRALIRNEFGDAFDLRFVKSSFTNLTEKAAHADQIIGLTNFMNHSQDATLSKAPTPYIRITGGMTALRQTLTNMAGEKDARVHH